MEILGAPGENPDKRALCLNNFITSADRLEEEYQVLTRRG